MTRWDRAEAFTLRLFDLSLVDLFVGLIAAAVTVLLRAPIFLALAVVLLSAGSFRR